MEQLKYSRIYSKQSLFSFNHKNHTFIQLNKSFSYKYYEEDQPQFKEKNILSKMSIKSNIPQFYSYKRNTLNQEILKEEKQFMRRQLDYDQNEFVFRNISACHDAVEKRRSSKHNIMVQNYAIIRSAIFNSLQYQNKGEKKSQNQRLEKLILQNDTNNVLEQKSVFSIDSYQ